jgi:hypothetical protein
MLKKLFKAALTACLVAGMSSAAMAWVPIGDSGLMIQLDTSSTWGQRNSGVEETSAWFQTESETNISLLGMKGPWTVWADIEFDDNDTMKAPTSTDPNKGLKDLDAVGSYIAYKVTPEFAVKIGTIHHGNGLQYNLGAGAFTSSYNHDGWNYSGWSESPGLEFRYQINADMSASFAMYSQAAAAMTGQAEGSANGIQFNAKFGGIAAKFGYLTEKYDDFSDANDEGQTNTFMNLGASIPIGDAMKVMVDYSSSAISWNVADHVENTTDLALAFYMSGVGPGQIRFTYAMIAQKDADDGYTVFGPGGAPEWAQTDMGLVYHIPLGVGQMQIQYMSQSKTPKDGDAVTASFLGFGYNIKL